MGSIEIINIIADTLEIDVNDLNIKSNLYEIGIDSISFIRLVIALESQMGIEFDDENLNVENYETIYDLNNYINSKIIGRN